MVCGILRDHFNNTACSFSSLSGLQEDGCKSDTASGDGMLPISVVCCDVESFTDSLYFYISDTDYCDMGGIDAV